MKSKILGFFFSFLVFQVSYLFAQTGPGGVGNSDGSGGQPQLVVWLDASNLSLSNGDPISTWSDVSGRGNNVTGSGANRALFQSSVVGLNSQASILFDGGNDYFIMADNNDVNNNGPYNATTISLAVRTGADVSTRQIIYEEGGGTRGFAIYIDAGNLYFSAWNLANDGGGNTPWGPQSFNTAISANTSYIISFVHDSGNTSLTGYLNGTSFGSVSSGIGDIYSHNELILGDRQADVYFHDGVQSGDGGYAYSGYLSEFIYYRTVLNSTQRTLVETYLGVKYGITVAGSLFGLGSNETNIAGVGQVGASDNHTSGTSNLVNLTGTFSTGEYVVIGHDNAATTFSTTESPASTTRLGREWRADITGVATKSITLNVDVSGFTLGTGQSYQILQDADGDFSAGATVHTGSVGSGTFTSTFTLNDGYYITLAKNPLAAPVDIDYSTATLSVPVGGTGNSVVPTVPDDGGSTVTNWAINSGGGTGISINSGTGQISVAATASVGAYTLNLDVTNAVGTTTFNSAFTVYITQAITSLSYSDNSQTVTSGDALNAMPATPTPAAPIGGSYTYSWDQASNPFQGVTLNTSTGEITGTPNTDGNFTAYVTATGNGAATGTASDFVSISRVGNSGVAGLGDNTSLVVHLDASTLSLSDSDPVSTWTDQSSNSNNGVSSGGVQRPTFRTGASGFGIGTKAAITFDGTSDSLGIVNAATLNSGTVYTQKTLTMVFRTGADVTTRQALFEQGGGTRGLNMYILSGNVYVNGWNLANDDAGLTTAWGPSSVNTAIATNTEYILTLVYDQGAGTIEGFLNGTSMGTATGVGRLFTHTGQIGIGGVINQTYFHDAVTSDGHPFNGRIAEFINYNIALNTSQRRILESSLGNKYGISISSPLFSHASYTGDIIGLGRTTVEDEHTSAVGDRITISNAGLADGDFVLVGDDEGSFGFQGSDIPAGIDSRLIKTWQADIVGTSPQTVDLVIDFTGQSLSGSQAWRLLVDSDGTFAAGASTISPNSTTASTATFNSLSLTDNYYFTLAKTIDATATAPVSLSYSTNPLNVTVGVGGSSVFPTVDDGGSSVTNYTINSGGGTGININASTGVITIDGSASSNTYTLEIGATNSVGTTNFPNALTINVQTPITNLSYSGEYQSIMLGNAINPAIASSTPAYAPTGGTFTYSWDLASNPYNGLTLNTTTGQVSGTPSSVEAIRGTITLTGGGVATGTQTADFTFNVVGTDGPGAVGDNTLLVHWVRADAISASDGDAVSTWDDQSSRNNDATQATGSAQPTFRNTVSGNDINGRPVLLFDGNDVLGIADTDDINTEAARPYQQRTLFMAFETGADITTRQTLYSEGGTGRGLGMYIRGGNLYVGAYNNNADDATTPWTGTYVNTAIATNTVYLVTMFFDRPNSQIRGSLNGTSFGSIGGIGNLFAHAGDIGIGGVVGGFVFDNGTQNGDGDYFSGKIAEFMIYNAVLNQGQVGSVENYLNGKYNVGIASPRHSYAAAHGGDVAGIDRVDSENQITFLRSSLVEISSPSTLGDGDYLYLGHDDASFVGNKTDVPTGIENRMNRVWRATVSGSPGTVTIAFNTNGFTISNDADLRLLVAPSASSGVFTSSTLIAKGAPKDPIIIQGTRNGNNYEFSGVTLNDGDFITLGSTEEATVLPITLSSFTVDADYQERPLIEWVTLTEIENYGFNLERRLVSPSDSSEWQNISFIEGKGNYFERSTYSFTDFDIESFGVYQYRLTQIDFDGTQSVFGPIEYHWNPAKETSLSPAFPNPFNPDTQFTFTISESSDVSIKLYNVVGQKVKTILNQPMSAGQFTRTIDGSNLASGVYFIRMITNNQQFVRRITLIK